MCLPPDYLDDENHIPIPRLEKRNNLSRAGLIGKIEFNSEMSPDEVRKVICTTFSSPMQLSQEDIERGDLFPFKYLQRLGAGSRTLHVPVISSSITWSGRQVVTLAKSSGMIYIMASSTLNVKYGDESETEDSLPEVEIPGIDDTKVK